MPIPLVSKSIVLAPCFLMLFCLMLGTRLNACTIFVFVHAGKTYFCNHEDWRDPVTQIRFNPAQNGNYGWVYFGFANDWAQGGVNEHGLCFDWFAGGGPYGWKSDPDKRNFDGNLSEELMRTCRNVDEAIAFYQRYNEANLENAVTLIADKEGSSLLVHWREGKLMLEKFQGRLHSCGVGKEKVEAMMQEKGHEFQLPGLVDALQSSVTEGEYATKYSSIISPTDGKIVLFQERNFDQYLEIDIHSLLQEAASTYRMADLFESNQRPSGISLKTRSDSPPFDSADLSDVLLKEFSTPIDLTQIDKFGFLKDRLDDVRIVGFGEDTHGTAEFTELAVDLMIYLAQEHGYRTFIIENGFGETTYLNDFINGRTNDVEGVLKTKISTWRYQTTQFVGVLNRLREYNETHPEQSIQLFGMEMHYPLEESKLLNTYLSNCRLTPLSATFDKTLYQPVSESNKSDWFIAYHKVKNELLENRERLISEFGEAKFRHALMYIQIIGQYVSAINQEGEQLQSDLRDIYMAVNVAKVLELQGHDSRALVWAHNAHIGDWVSNGSVDVLGHQLKKRYGQAYFNIASHFGTGSFLAFPHEANEAAWKLKEIRRDVIAKNSFTYSLNEFAAMDLFVDFVRARSHPKTKGLLNESLKLMSGAGAQVYGTETTEAEWGTAFDGMIFVHRSTPIQLVE